MMTCMTDPHIELDEVAPVISDDVEIIVADLDEATSAIAAWLADQVMPWDALIIAAGEAAAVHQTLSFSRRLGGLAADWLAPMVKEDHYEVSQAPILIERVLRRLVVPPTYAPVTVQIVALATEEALARLTEIVPL